MTNETKAPERIFMDPDIKFPECEKQYGCDVEYIQNDLHLSLVAAAYDNAASRVNQLSHTATATGNFTQASALANEAENIRDSTPADAQAALEARDKRVREEALREAIAVCEPGGLTHHGPDDYRICQSLILALIEKDKSNE